MKKALYSFAIAALMVPTAVVVAQEAEVELAKQAAETVEAVVEASAPAEDVVPTAVAVIEDAQESVSDGVALEQAAVPAAVPMIGSEGIIEGGIVTSSCGQAMAPSSCCNSCCGEASFAQPVAFNQPIYQDAVVQAVPEVQPSVGSIVTAAPVPAPAAIYAQPVSDCGSCSGGEVVNYAPAETSFAPSESCCVEAAPPVAQCGVCEPAPPVCEAPSCNTDACCPPTNRLRQRISSRLGGVVLGRLIDDR